MTEEPILGRHLLIKLPKIDANIQTMVLSNRTEQAVMLTGDSHAQTHARWMRDYMCQEPGLLSSEQWKV